MTITGFPLKSTAVILVLPMLLTTGTGRNWAQSQAAGTSSQPADGGSDGTGASKSSDGFFRRLVNFYRDDRNDALASSEHSIMWGHWIGTTVLFRPEPRFEHSYDLPAYDKGAKSSQFTFAVDAIFKF